VLVLCDVVSRSEYWVFEDFAQFWLDAKFDRAERTEHGRRIEGGGRELPKTVRYRPRTFWPWVERLPLVVIDDIGLRDRANDSQYEALKLLLDRRVGLPLVLTSNHDLDTIGKIFDARIYDRLFAGTLVELHGPSLR